MNPDYTYYRPLISNVAVRTQLDPSLVAAVVWTESNFRADAFRHEPQFWKRYMATSPAYKHLHPRRYSSSYGLMQPMWVTAVEEGFDPNRPPEDLFSPELSLTYGCKRLRGCLNWAMKFQAPEKDALLAGLAAYNGGRNSANAPPNPRNIKYALRVWQHLTELA